MALWRQRGPLPWCFHAAAEAELRQKRGTTTATREWKVRPGPNPARIGAGGQLAPSAPAPLPRGGGRRALPGGARRPRGGDLLPGQRREALPAGRRAEDGGLVRPHGAPAQLARGSDTSSVEASVARLLEFLQRLQREGVPAHRIVVGGFSMGGGIALQLALRHPGSLGAVFALSSYLCDDAAAYRLAEGSRGVRRPPVFMAHGRADSFIQFAWGEATARRLGGLGVPVRFVPLPGVGHELASSEIDQLGAWIGEDHAPRAPCKLQWQLKESSSLCPIQLSAAVEGRSGGPGTMESSSLCPIQLSAAVKGRSGNLGGSCPNGRAFVAGVVIGGFSFSAEPRPGVDDAAGGPRRAAGRGEKFQPESRIPARAEVDWRDFAGKTDFAGRQAAVAAAARFTFLTGSHDRSLLLWDTRVGGAGAAVARWRQQDWVTCVEFHPTDQDVLLSSDKAVRQWDFRRPGSGALGVLHRHRKLVSRFRVDPLRLASCSLDGSVKVSSLEPPEFRVASPRGRAAPEAGSPCGKESDEVCTLRTSTDYVLCIGFDATRLLAGGVDGRVELFDFSQPGHFRKGTPSPLLSPAAARCGDPVDVQMTGLQELEI
ncbi:unnamed protein product [Prorocentrum cordatum]|uniref:Phospholipase/carboxylesterase/thioesterase domain-containing protein n=1 Tax=Prorocentrum cordatum TaxID=2364126 RepID=A0ABN9T6Y1_9DINO|nr:unnamed protein product [Polarella glacialis]